MPLYVYECEAEGEGCEKCRNGFEIMQSLNDDKLTTCPECGARIRRVIFAPELMHSRTDLHYRAKRAGFKCLKKVQKGEYETIY